MPLGVAMLAGVFTPSIGGIQTHTLQLARKLVEHGVDVHVLTRHHPGLPREETIDGASVHRVGNGSLPRGIRVGSYLTGALAMLRELRDRVQVVHAHQMFAPAFVGCLARGVSATPLVVNPHSPAEVRDLEALGIAGRMHLAALRRHADAFVSICSPVRAELLRAGVDEARIHSIPNGVDTEVFRPATAAERTRLRTELGFSQLPAVVYAGRIEKVKGVDVLLEAWPRLDDTAQLYVVGDGEQANTMRARAAGLRNVRFVGPVRTPLPYLSAADAAVIPSRGEGLSVALLEAMACGLPTVATAVGGSPDAIDDGVDGLLVPPEDPAALARALAQALRIPSLGTAARRRIVERHSIDAVAGLTLALYFKVCGVGPRRDRPEPGPRSQPGRGAELLAQQST